MARIDAAELHLIPNFPVTRLKSRYVSDADIHFPEEFVRSLDYEPHQSVIAKQTKVDKRSILQIKDRYTPPAQTETGPKIDPEAVYHNLVPNIVLGIMDAAIPAAALFHLGDRTYWSVASFNENDRSFANTYHSPPNAHDAAQKVLTDKMGIVETGTGLSGGWIKINQQTGTQKRFGLEGTANIAAGPTAVAEIAYASVLLSHHLDVFLQGMEPGDHVCVEAVTGRQTPRSHFFIVEKRTPTTNSQGRVLNENFGVLVKAGSMYPFVCHDLNLEPKDNRFRDYRKDGGEAILFEALAEDQGLTGPDPWWEHLDKLAKGEKEPFQVYLEKSRARRVITTALRDKIVPKLESVRVIFANSADSVPTAKWPERTS